MLLTRNSHLPPIVKPFFNIECFDRVEPLPSPVEVAGMIPGQTLPYAIRRSWRTLHCWTTGASSPSTLGRKRILKGTTTSLQGTHARSTAGSYRRPKTRASPSKGVYSMTTRPDRQEDRTCIVGIEARALVESSNEPLGADSVPWEAESSGAWLYTRSCCNQLAVIFLCFCFIPSRRLFEFLPGISRLYHPRQT